jgi:hypothetical protein
MCWNAPVSLASFLAGLLVSFGMGFLALKHKKIELAVLSFGWSGVICMQLFEYMIWMYPNNNIYARWAFVFNITQPLLLGLLFLAFFEHPSSNKIAVCSLLFFYTFYILYYTNDLIIHVSEKDHLQYNWWGKELPYGGLIYILTLCGVFLLLVRPLGWSVRTLAMILLLLFISSLFYSDCVSSMWCFFAVFIPIISFIMY